MSRFPKFRPNDDQRRQVTMLAGFGFDQKTIGVFLNISHVSLRKFFRKELDIGPTEANLRVASALYKNATTNGNVTAQIFWMKSRMGWRDRDVAADQQGENELRYVVEMPPDVDNTDDWLRLNAPPIIDGSAE